MRVSLNDLDDRLQQWKPTERLIHGTLIKAFLPLKKHPKLIHYSTYYFNLYPGDEVYVYEESTDGKWCRAYICWNPLPENYISISASLGDKLPDVSAKEVIFPKSFASLNYDRIIETVQALKLPEQQDFLDSIDQNACISHSMYDFLEKGNIGQAQKGPLFTLSLIRKAKPPFPFFRYHDRPFVDEFGPILGYLVSHIYTMYSTNKFDIYEKLVQLYEELNRIRLRLRFDLTTESEKNLLIKSATSFLAKLAKYVSGKDKEYKSNSLEDQGKIFFNITHNDPAGFEGIFCRNINTGELESVESTPFGSFVKHSVLYGLANDFPLKNTNLVTNYSTVKDKYLKYRPSHILVDFKDIVSNPTIDDPHFKNLHALMYLRTNKETLTEAFTVNMYSENIEALSNISAALFGNLQQSKIEDRNVFLVVVLVEDVPVYIPLPKETNVTSFIPNTSEAPLLSSVKRGVAAGVCDISHVFSGNKDALATGMPYRFKINLFGSAFSSRNTDCTNLSEALISMNSDVKIFEGNCGWGTLIDNILSNSSIGVAVNPRAISLWVSVKEIKGENALQYLRKSSTVAIRNIPTYSYDRKANPVERVYAEFGDVSLCGSLSSEYDIGNVSIKLVSSSKNVLFSRSTNDIPTNNWELISVQPGECIGELLRITGIENAQENESIGVFAYLNGFLLATSSIPVRHESRIIEYNRGSEILLLSSKNEHVMTLKLTSKYHGSKFNMNYDIDCFLKLGRTLKKGNEWKEALLRLVEVERLDLMKYFDDILKQYLDLIHLINSDLSYQELQNELNTEVFISLLRFLDKLMIGDDSCREMFSTFTKTHNFESNSLPQIGEYLVKMYQYSIDDLYADNIETFHLCSKLFFYILTLSTITSNNFQAQWKKSMAVCFGSISNFLSISNPKVSSEQALIFNNIDLSIDILIRQYGPEHMVDLFSKLFESCDLNETIQNYAKRRLQPYEYIYFQSKLSLIYRIVSHSELHEFLFVKGTSNPTRLIFISKVMDWALQVYQTSKGYDLTSLRLSNTIIITLLDNVTDNEVLRNFIRLLPAFGRLFLKLELYCKKLDLFKPKTTFTQLFPANAQIQILPIEASVKSVVLVEVLLELTTIICALAKISNRLYGKTTSLGKIISDCSGDSYFKSKLYLNFITRDDFLSIICLVKHLIKGDFFPSSSWLSVSALILNSSMRILEMFKNFLIIGNLSTADFEDNFDINMWAEYMTCVLKVANNKLSYIVHLAIIPRKGVNRLTFGMKEIASLIINDCWNALSNKPVDKILSEKYGVGLLSPYQRSLIFDHPLFLRQLVGFSFHRNISALIISTKIFCNICLDQWVNTKSFKTVMSLYIPAFYDSFRNNATQLDEYQLDVLMKAILYTFHVPKDDKIIVPLESMLKLFYQFLIVVIDALNIPKHKEFANDRTIQQIELLIYLLEADRPESFFKLLNNLFNHFIEEKDNVQAALCIEAMANVYKWNPNDLLSPMKYPQLPQQSSFERKEHLYKEAARYFTRGSKLEKSLTLYKDLAKAYEKINYDLEGLAFVYARISGIYSKLQTVDRLVPTYFKVIFTGFGFPKSLRSKVFIFEGLPFEHISSMHTRLLRLYHGSAIIESQERSEELQITPNVGKYIYVATVEPKLDLSDEYSSSSKSHILANKVRMYIENRNLRTFTSLRRMPGTTNVTNLRVEEFTCVTASTFPTLLNKTEVCKMSVRKLSPLENALRILELKIQELIGLEIMCDKIIKDGGSFTDVYHELSRNITGTIAAPINGGMAQYREFLRPPHSQKIDSVELSKLLNSFDELAMVLGRCLIIEANILPSKEFESSHKTLVDLFQKNFAEEIKRQNIEISDISLETLTMIRSKTLNKT